MENILVLLFLIFSLWTSDVQKGKKQFPVTIEGQQGHEYYRGYYLDKSIAIKEHVFHPKKGIEFLKLAVERNDPLAMFDLAEVYEKGIYGEDVNKQKANELIKKSVDGIEFLAKKGNVRAQFYLGEIYKYGLANFETDVSKAYALHKKVAEKENPLGWFALADWNVIMYEHNVRDIRYNLKALELYKKASDAGLLIATREMAKMYLNGKTNRPIDKKTAKFYFKKSEKDYLSMMYLGDLYRYKKNKKESMKYYEQAAKNGAPDAYYFVARNAKTFKEATYYLGEAKKRGVKEADSYLDYLKKEVFN